MPLFTVEVTEVRVLRFQNVEAADEDAALAWVMAQEGKYPPNGIKATAAEFTDPEIIYPPNECQFRDRHNPNHGPERVFPIILYGGSGSFVGTEQEILAFVNGGGFLCGSEFDWWEDFDEPTERGHIVGPEYRPSSRPQILTHGGGDVPLIMPWANDPS